MSQYVFFRWVWSDPPILFTAYDGSVFPEARLHRLQSWHWRARAADVERTHDRLSRECPGHTVHYLLNEKSLYLKLRGSGLPVHWINHNGFLDERLFQPRPVARDYDAVYVARFNPFKRHHLAARIARLLCIGDHTAPSDPRDYRPELAATFAGRLSQKQTAEAVCRAHVGLALSEREGAMYACGEYLLAGLPVVSTMNDGGRNEWLHPDFSRVVPPDADCIAAAVEDLTRASLDPGGIRAMTLDSMRQHRARYIELVQGILDSTGVHVDFGRHYYESLVHKNGEWRPVDELVLPAAAGGAAGSVRPD